MNQVATGEGGATTEITVPVGAPDPSRAAEILREIEAQMRVIEEAGAEAANASGLMAALAISRVQTEKLTLASRRASWMAATYGSILPVEVAATAPQGAKTPPDQSSREAVSANTDDPLRPEWADPNHPEIDYTAAIFSQLHREGFALHGWWGLIETRAEIDDTAKVIAINFSNTTEGFSMRAPRLQTGCQEGEASFVYDADTFISGDFRSNAIQTTFRIDDQPAQTTSWSQLASSKGSGLFGSRGEAMLRDLYDAEKIFLRTDDRSRHDATFDLAGIKPVVEAVARACSFSLLDLSNDDYRAIQTILNAAGFDAGSPDGIWGEGSARAMRQWQEQNWLPATGAPDRATLAAMGITSEEAPDQAARAPETPRQNDALRRPRGGRRRQTLCRVNASSSPRAGRTPVRQTGGGL